MELYSDTMDWVTHNSIPWASAHYEVPIISSILYLLSLVVVPWLMKDREAFKLETPLALWNFFLAAFSIIGCIKINPGLVNEWINGIGISRELCTLDHEVQPWLFLFIFSKIPEFADTFFIMLRKKPLILLQWFHHVTTMWFCWLAVSLNLPNGATFSGMNLFVHSIMYTYYGCSALRIFWPQWARITITVLQILQMFGGMAAIIHNLIVCPGPNTAVYLGGLAMYASFALLFMELFYKNYCIPQKKGATKAE